jgi:2-hydroxy-3-oxopropionate reductase
MTNIAFIGLGIMGGPMAANLVAAGHQVAGYNRSRPAIDRLAEQGGRAAESVADALDGADAVITMLPDSPDVEAVVLDQDGILAHARPGLLYIDNSSIAPAAARRVIEAATAQDIRAVDAPVSGGEQAAIEGTLSIMVGGDPEHFRAAAPILEVLGSTIVHVGPAGSGSTVKAANQLIVAGTIQLVAEALVFLEAHGVDTEAAVRVLAGGLAGNRILDRKASGMIERNFTPGFRVDLHHKDLGILLDAARAAGVATPAGALVAQLMASVRARGHGDLDHTALLELVDELSGRARD